MKKLIICAIVLLCGCASTWQVPKSVYGKELKEGRINHSEYNYLLKGQKELNKMK
jgi:hypothetical protein